jgi:hypothetical protein
MPSASYSSKVKNRKYSQEGAKSADSKLSVPSRKKTGERLDRYAKKQNGGLRRTVK